jgi:hypothetical protein
MRALLFGLALAGCGRAVDQPPECVLPDGGPPPVDVPSIVRTCAMEQSCLPSPPFSTAGDCVATFERDAALTFGSQFIACAVKNPDCAGALQCVSRGHGPTYCAVHPGYSCDSDFVVDCDLLSGWALFAGDCAAAGMRCVFANGSAGCTVGTACDPNMPPAPRCDCNVADECDGFIDMRSRTDCGLVGPGFICQDGRCQLPSVPCAQSAQSCRGDLFDECYGGRLTTTDCAAIGSRCDPAGGCIALGADCTTDDKDRCNGDALQICVNGSWRDFPCASIGFTTCRVGAHGGACAD